MIGLAQAWLRRLDRFLFESCDPQLAPILRIGFALLVSIQTLVVWPDAAYWYCDSGVLRSQTAAQILGPRAWSLLNWLPSEPWAARLGLLCLGLHSLLMLLGFYSRFQVAAIFVWLVSFQNRNPLITDGEDTVFRILAFLLIWLPLDARWSVRSLAGSKSAGQAPSSKDAWALRLIQFQMTVIYASTALCKMEGETWQNGSAVWYVSRMTDNFGRWISPEWFDWPWVSPLATWGTLAVEAVLPIGLWIPKTRWVTIVLAVLMHLGIEGSMNLFLFQWIMLLGLISFAGRSKVEL
ncbi:MAG: HTTM domain-containing protein [Planctomycetota bacterium]|nr:HTTM domain-containing protein [Planctomycetota bacterium]